MFLKVFWELILGDYILNSPGLPDWLRIDITRKIIFIGNHHYGFFCYIVIKNSSFAVSYATLRYEKE